MNLERLEKLATHLESGELTVDFDYSHHCTCALGEMAHLFPETSKLLTDSILRKEKILHSTKAADFLGIDKELALFIFIRLHTLFPWKEKLGSQDVKITRHHVAKALRCIMRGEKITRRKIS